MPHEAFGWNTRIKAVEREYITARLAMDRLDLHAKDDPVILTGDLRVRDIASSSARLEGTYIIRLFAEFETGLRQFMRAFKYRIPKSTAVLLNRVKDRVGISKDGAASAHAVRDYRNTLIHDRQQPATPLSVRNATEFLGQFMGWLQRYW
jgi:hypothetical protein